MLKPIVSMEDDIFMKFVEIPNNAQVFLFFFRNELNDDCLEKSIAFPCFMEKKIRSTGFIFSVLKVHH